MNVFVCLVIASSKLDLFGTFTLWGEVMKMEMLPGSHAGDYQFRLFKAGDYKTDLGVARFVWNRGIDEIRKALDLTEAIGELRVKFPQNDEVVVVPMYYTTARSGRPVFMSKPGSKAHMPFFGL